MHHNEDFFRDTKRLTHLYHTKILYKIVPVYIQYSHDVRYNTYILIENMYQNFLYNDNLSRGKCFTDRHVSAAALRTAIMPLPPMPSIHSVAHAPLRH